MADITVLVGTHNFTVRGLSPRARTCIEGFAKRYIEYGHVKQGRQWVYSAVRVYAAATKDRSEFRFHINTMDMFKTQLNVYNFKDEQVEFIFLPVNKGYENDLPIFPQWQPRGEQPKVIDYITDEGENRSRFVNLQTGKGKSFCTMAAASRMRVLPVLVCKPMYIEKWLIDLVKTYDIDKDDIITVQGGAQLMALLALFEEQKQPCAPSDTMGEPPAKFIIISNKTYQLWIKLYEEHGDKILEMGYPCLPGDLYEFLGCDLRVIDEVHQDFHLNFKIDLYTHCPRSVSLSATLVADNPFITTMYNLAYPKHRQFIGEGYDRYITTTGVFYNNSRPGALRYLEPSQNRYSHNLYEQNILKYPQTKDAYFRLIREILEFSYIKTYKPGYKLMIFVASVNMATELRDYLARIYPDMSVTRYVEQDEYVNVMESDIRVSTLLSSGTAVDIPGLQTTLLSAAVSSTQANIQGLGRLRKLDDGTAPHFIWLVCEDIPQHISYHEKKRVMLEPLTIGYRKHVVGIKV